MADKCDLRHKWTALVVWAGIVGISLINPYTTPCCAFFTGIKNEVRNEVHSIKDSQTKEFSDIKAGINDVSVSLGKIETNLNAQAQVQAKIQMGVDKSNTQSAGRDIKTSIYNDPKVWQSMAGILFAIIMFLLKDNMSTKKWLCNVIKSKMEYKEKLEKLGGKL